MQLSRSIGLVPLTWGRGVAPAAHTQGTGEEMRAEAPAGAKAKGEERKAKAAADQAVAAEASAQELLPPGLRLRPHRSPGGRLSPCRRKRRSLNTVRPATVAPLN